jgi:hypothetical protein
VTGNLKKFCKIFWTFVGSVSRQVLVLLFWPRLRAPVPLFVAGWTRARLTETWPLTPRTRRRASGAPTSMLCSVRFGDSMIELVYVQRIQISKRVQATVPYCIAVANASRSPDPSQVTLQTSTRFDVKFSRDSSVLASAVLSSLQQMQIAACKLPSGADACGH